MNNFFSPRSVAIAGASKSAMKLGNVPIENLLRFGYGGRIIPLNRDGGEIMGLRAFRSVEDVDGSVDLAVAVIPRENVYGFIESCGRAGVRNVIVTAAAFADADAEGARMQEEVAALARRLSIRLMGPNSIGTIDTGSGLVTSIITLDPIPRGRISFVVQSGLFSAGFARWISSSQMHGAAKIACLGNKADVNELDVLAYLEDDPRTDVIALHTEGTKDGAAFVDLVSRISTKKPVVVLNAGRTPAGREATRSHTGALAGSFEVFQGAASQAGAVAVESFTEMFDCARALDYCPLPGGNGMGVVSITGAGCSLTADACGEHGLEVPPLSEESLRYATEGMPAWVSFSNPADIWAAISEKGSDGAYYRLLKAMAMQDGVDILLAVYCVAPQFEFDAAAVMGRIREQFPDKPLLAVLLGGTIEDSRRWFESLESARIPAFDSVERAVAAAAALNRYSTWLRSSAR
ncbi:MAG: CoA-binding protein [Candidatus Geothermincolia bacterium]